MSTQRRSWVEQIMGLPISVLVRGPEARTRPDISAAVRAVFAQLREVDRIFSTYRPDSDISRLQRREVTVAGCHRDVAAVLDLCAQARQVTDGWFDVQLPDAGGLGRFEPSGLRRIDPSGLVKGWAVERAAEALAGCDGCDWVLNAGGDVVALATHGEPWRVGVEDPAARERMLAVLSVRGGGVATSGSAARGDHVLDPHTGRPARGLAAATVVGPSLMWADVYATAAFARGPTALPWLATLSGYDALLVLPDGATLATRGWPARG